MKKMTRNIRGDETDAGAQESREGKPGMHEVADQGPVVMVMALLMVLGITLGLFAASAFDAVEAAQAAATVEATSSETTQATKAKAEDAPAGVSLPEPNWQPPVTPKIVIKPPLGAEQSQAIAEKWGVEILSLSLTAANYMMDFRFRVLDVNKSEIFFDQRIKPYLLVEKSHAKLPVPMAAKVGAFRATNRGRNIKPNKIYYIVFGNPDAHVKSGDKVTLVIGDFKAEHLTVH